jgi:hypothetical protein
MTRASARRRALLALVPGILACGLASCSAIGVAPDPDWQEIEVATPSDRVLWKVLLLAVEHAGFPVTGSLDPAAGEIRTGWKTNLQPFSGKGTRMRAIVTMEPKERRLWLVRSHVQKQVNEALVAPLDPARAEWEWTDDDPLQAQILLRHVLATFPSELELLDAPTDPFDERIEERRRRLERSNS